MTRDVIKSSDDLDARQAQFGDVDKAINDLFKFGKRNRQLIKWTIVSLVIDIIITVALIGLAVVANRNSQSIEDNRARIIATCEGHNEVATAEQKLWSYILSIPPQQPRTAQQEKTIADFRTFLDETFKQHDCSVEG